MNGWTYVTSVESDTKPGKEYVIERRGDGAMRCACERFRFTRGEIGSTQKTCKHLLALNGMAAPVLASFKASQSVKETVRVAIESGGRSHMETFTFRRAISFDGSLGGRS